MNLLERPSATALILALIFCARFCWADVSSSARDLGGLDSLDHVRKSASSSIAAGSDPLAWFERLKKAAVDGDPAAQTQLGFLYDEGRFGQRNVKEALKWYQTAAQK